MNKKGIVAEKTGFYILYIFLFMFAFLYAASFLKVSKAEFNSDEIEDSIIATRVLNCFSDDNFLLDKTKMNVVDLRRCFSNDKYFLEIKLNDEEVVKNIPGELHNFRDIKRYVKLNNNEEGILKIKYVKKNVA